jgi:hypothetical protein
MAMELEVQLADQPDRRTRMGPSWHSVAAGIGDSTLPLGPETDL